MRDYDRGVNGRVHQINVSGGGVPKLPVPRAFVGVNGVEGDRQADTKHHGGPERAVCLFSLELIEALRAEGHPIGPGTTGENLTISGIEWASVVPGGRFVFDNGPELEVSGYTKPCSAIRGSFLGLDMRRIQQDVRPGWSRVYARVAREGMIANGMGVRYVAPV